MGICTPRNSFPVYSQILCTKYILSAYSPQFCLLVGPWLKPSKKFSMNYVQWSPEMDSALLGVLVEHHNNSDHAQNRWKPHVL
jgi:hypothetical protein